MYEGPKTFDGKRRQNSDGSASRTSLADPRTFHSSEIFGDALEIIIVHDGDRYRLRRTSKGKLILMK